MAVYLAAACRTAEKAAQPPSQQGRAEGPARPCVGGCVTEVVRVCLDGMHRDEMEVVVEVRRAAVHRSLPQPLRPLLDQRSMNQPAS